MQILATIILIACAAVSVVLTVVYARVWLQKKKEVKKSRVFMQGDDAAFSGLSTDEFDALRYVQDHSTVCGLVNMGVTMDDRHIFDCEIEFRNS